MNIVNRDPMINDVMFKELTESALYRVSLDNFHYDLTLELNGKSIADVEDFLMVYNTLKEGQAKLRIAEIFSKDGVARFKKSDKLTIVISPKAPSKEPGRTYEITEFFDEVGDLVPGLKNAKEVFIQPNKWLYVALKMKSK